MSVYPSSVPQVRRPRDNGRVPPDVIPVGYCVAARFDARFPAPDDEHDDVDQVSFAGEYLSFVLVLITVTAGFAAFILAPMLGLILAL